MKPNFLEFHQKYFSEWTQEWLPNFDPHSRCLIYGDIASRYIGLPENILEEVRAAGFSITHWRVQGNDEPDDFDDLLLVAQKPES